MLELTEMAVTVRHPSSEDGGQLARLYREAFGLKVERWESFAEEVRYDYGRAVVVCDDGEVASHARYHDFRMFLRGVPVRVAGVADVGTLSEYRRRGYASLALKRIMEYCFEAGYGAAILYPFMPSFYQRFQWELVGLDMTVNIKPQGVAASMPEGFRFTPFREEDLPALMAFYERTVSRRFSPLVREEWMWRRRLKGKKVILIRGPGGRLGGEGKGLAGYIVASVDFKERRVVINEWMADGEEALMAVFWYARTWGNVLDRVVIRLPSLDLPLGLLLRDCELEAKLYNGLMGRIIKLEEFLGSLRLGGFTEHISFHLRDSLLPQNSGAWRVEADGEGKLHAERIGRDTKAEVELDARGLSGILFGAYTLRTLRNAGLAKIHGEEGILERWDPHPGAALCSTPSKLP